MTTSLVLGGGGIAGVAWETGLLIGLQRAGADLTGADQVIGTSAGSIVGSWVASGTDLQKLADRPATVSPPVPPPSGGPSAAAGPSPSGRPSPSAGLPPSAGQPPYAGPSPATGPSSSAGPPPAAGAPPATGPAGISFESIMAVLAPMFDPALDPAEARRRVGAAACAAAAGEEDEHIARIAALLPPGSRWPERRLLVTAVDTQTGELAVWDRDSAAPLDRAVASSCAVPGAFPPVTIGGRRYMDGGIRSGTNADLAAGAATVMVLDAIGHLMPREQIQAELAALGTASTMVIIPDQAAAAIIGTNLMDPAIWAAALAAGLAQAGTCAAQALSLWQAG
jgi:NTE family protein